MNQIFSSFVKADFQLIILESKPNPEVRRASSRAPYPGTEPEKKRLLGRDVTMKAAVAMAELQRSCLQMEGGSERSAITAALNHLVFI